MARYVRLQLEGFEFLHVAQVPLLHTVHCSVTRQGFDSHDSVLGCGCWGLLQTRGAVRVAFFLTVSDGSPCLVGF